MGRTTAEVWLGATGWAHRQPKPRAFRLDLRAGEFGKLEYVIASMQGGYTPEGWVVYGQHPAWTVMTLCGPDVEAVSPYAKALTAHGFVACADRKPAEIWYGRPDLGGCPRNSR